MRQIHKFTLRLERQQVLTMPLGSLPLAVQAQHGNLQLWVIVPVEAKPSEMVITIYGTGHELGADERRDEYIGTAQLDGFVWHVFGGWR